MTRPDMAWLKWEMTATLKDSLKNHIETKLQVTSLMQVFTFLSPKVFDYIPSGRSVSVEREVFPKLAEEGKLCWSLCQWLMDGYRKTRRVFGNKQNNT